MQDIAELVAALGPGGRALRGAANSIADRIGASLVVLDQSAHNPQVEQPDAFNDLLRRTWA